MENEYHPRLSHAVWVLLLGCGLIAGSAIAEDAVLTALMLGGGALILYSLVIVAFLSNRERIAFYDAVTRLADRLSTLDHDQWQALGIAFPTLRIHWNGEPIQLVEDSDFTVDEFRQFMDDSDIRQISPMRNWPKGRALRTWLRIKAWLEHKGHIYEASAAGNHSWLWRGNAYHMLRERYLAAQPLPDMTVYGEPVSRTAE